MAAGFPVFDLARFAGADRATRYALGSEVETGKQAQAGTTVQSSIMSSGAMSSFYPKYQIITTPFLFPNYRVAWEYFDGPWHAEFMRGAIEEAGLRYLGTFDDGGGFVAFTNNVRPIRTVDDIKGLRIRVEEHPAHVATMKALGASATPLPWTSVIGMLRALDNSSSWWPMPWTMMILMPRLRSTAMSVRMFGKLSSATMMPSSAITKVWP